MQGDRDALGRRDEVESYRLAPGVRLVWALDGDHDLKPRKASGRTHAQAIAEAAAAAAAFMAGAA